MAALIATFLLLVAGVLVTAPGLMTASASGSSKPANVDDGKGGGKDDDGGNGDDENQDENNDNGDHQHGHHHENECENEDENQDEHEAEDENQAEDEDQGGDEIQAEGDDFKATMAGVDNNGDDSKAEDENQNEDENQAEDENQNEDENEDDDETSTTVDDDECPVDVTSIQAYKLLGDDHGGLIAPEEFQLLLDGQPMEQSIDIPVTPGPHTVSEADVFGYTLVGILCTDNTGDQISDDGDLMVEAGQQILCEVVNDEIAPSITLTKELIEDDGGAAVPEDFALTVNDVAVAQGMPFTDIMANEVAVVSEEPNPGYTTASIVCTSDIADSPNTTSVEDSSSLELTPVLGENISCVITNDDVAPTVTITKVVVGSPRAPGTFQMLLGGLNAAQGVAIPVKANTALAVGEVLDNAYVSNVSCVDIGDPDMAPLDSPLVLIEGENALCTVTNTLKNVDGAVDLSITKTDNGLDQVAGGDSFDYTITVDNLGPGDPSGAVTVTDLLPAGLTFVDAPANCTPSGQTLACDIDPADVQVDDDPVVLIVTVKADADATTGTYTNLAYVTTPQDPISEPTCQTESNNVACESTNIHRQASITVDKEASVTQVSPGQSYSYTMTVANPGPSTFLANLKLTDDLPAGLHLDSVTPGANWSCNDVDPLQCTFSANVQPGVTTPAITIGVTLDAGFTGNTITNSATAIAIVDPPVSNQEQPALHATATTSDPGTVVTATDDATTPVVRNADLAIVKTVSQATVAAGGQFNWILDVTNSGPNAAIDVVVNDTLPAQFAVVAPFPPAGVTCTNTTTSVQCTAPSLAPGSSLHIVIQVATVNGAALGTATNTATVSTTSTDSNQGNNTDSESIDVVGSQSLPPTPPGVDAQAPTAQLPRTGNSPLGGPLTLASLLVAGGMFSLVIARRRRSSAAQ
ncbi:MAG TPA: hypothetical protein VHQ23_05175 [Ilumatobacteraceae bacterium]|nr:hypothetical protein [Ilumatobacteraceae bacterium]